MNKEVKQLLFIFVILTGVSVILGCTHTFHGMKQDIREDTDSSYDTDKPKVTVIKKTEVVYPSQSLPNSPPPLQTPPSQ